MTFYKVIIIDVDVINYHLFTLKLLNFLNRIIILKCLELSVAIFISESWRYAPGLYWKITWPPLLHTSALKIVPRTGCTSIHRGFCKILWYCSILFYFESVRSIVIFLKKKTIFFTGLNVFFRALNFRFWQVSQGFDVLSKRDFFLSELFVGTS